jgi:hypothetical protein
MLSGELRWHSLYVAILYTQVVFFFVVKIIVHGMGIPLDNITLYTLQFADDQVVLAGDKEDLEYMTHKLKETYEKWGLDTNLNKTKYLCIWGNTQQFEIR